MSSDGAPSSSLQVELIERVQSGGLAEQVKGYLQSRSAIAKIAQRSYMHPNGFRKLVLDEAVGGKRIRVHLWRASSNRSVSISNVHNHRWDFASMNVMGLVTSEIHVVYPSERTMNHFEFTPAKAGSRYGLRHVGESGTRVDSVRTFAPTMSYELAARQLHRVRIPGDAMTIVVSGPPVSNTTDVFREKEADAQDRRLKRLSEREARADLSLCLSRLNDLGHQ